VLEQAAQIGCRCLVPRGVQCQVGWGPVPPDLVLNVEVGGPAVVGGWRFMMLEVPSNPGHSVILWNAWFYHLQNRLVLCMQNHHWSNKDHWETQSIGFPWQPDFFVCFVFFLKTTKNGNTLGMGLLWIMHLYVSSFHFKFSCYSTGISGIQCAETLLFHDPMCLMLSSQA